MKALLVGAGGMGQAWARNLEGNGECELAGWIDIRPGVAAEAAAKMSKEIFTGDNLRQAIERVGPDFVVDVTSPEAHHAVTTTALSMGIPVLGEKPMAANMDQAKEMVCASEQAGKLYMVSQSRRYEPGMVALRTAIEKVGQLGILNADFYIGAHFGGFRDEMESPLLLDMAIHTFDQARFLCSQDPVSVIAEEFNPSWSWYRGAASANVSFTMTNGVRFTYRGSWCAEGLPTSWEGDWRAVGSNGTATWQNNGPINLDIPTGEGFIKESHLATIEPPEITTGIAGSLAEFLSSLNIGTLPQGECHDNIRSFAMIFAAKEASQSGTRTPVRWQ